MTPSGHIGASFLLSQTPALFGYPLTPKEEVAIVISGSVIDLDLLLPFFSHIAQSHHNFPTHTPAFLGLVWLVFFLIYGKHHFSQLANYLVLTAMIGHLVLDEFTYWFYRAGWQSMHAISEINWFYPLTDFVSKPETAKSIFAYYQLYFSQARLNVALEICFIVTSVLILLRRAPQSRRR